MAVTELSPGRLFRILILPAGCSGVPNLAPSTKTSFNHDVVEAHATEYIEPERY